MRILFTFILTLLNVSCSLLLTSPEATVSKDRLKNFPTSHLPLKDNVDLYWNQYMVPFIHANDDGDAAFVMGMVNAHLRLGQMELVKRVASGRLSELAGPLASDIDHSLRIIGLRRAAKKLAESLPEDSRLWSQRFVDGINFYIDETPQLPIEFELFQFEKERWTLEDVMTIGRLAGVDLSWMYYAQFLRLRNKPNWQQVWNEFIKVGQQSTPSFADHSQQQFFEILASLSRSGSNSIVISKDKSAGKSALIANDPHLGIFAPNFWLLQGLKSPSYHAVGMSIPGLPFIAVGRNPDVAWGGTNMRSISSHLYELNEKEAQAAKVLKETIKVRWWFDKDIDIRISDKGPILSDSPFFNSQKPLALDWVGYNNSDELTSFLRASRSKNWQEFKEAFSNYAVSGQNILYADKEGNIAQLLAYRQPVLKKPEETLKFIKASDNPVVSYRGPQKLPHIYNPKEGFIASANNQPVKTDIPIGFSFSSNNRIERLKKFAATKQKVSMKDLEKWQQDVFSKPSFELKNLLTGRCPDVSKKMNETFQNLWTTLARWDGHYKVESRGALAFEVTVEAIISDLLSGVTADEELQETLARGTVWQEVSLREIKNMSCTRLDAILSENLKDAAESFSTYENWGDLHHLKLGSPLQNLPMIGDRFNALDIPYPGSRETLLKAAHGIHKTRNNTTYGAISRHISDLSDPDENYFVLLGGQDGWLKNDQMSNQVDLWLKGEYIHLPLTLEAVKKAYPNKMKLKKQPSKS